MGHLRVFCLLLIYFIVLESCCKGQDRSRIVSNVEDFIFECDKGHNSLIIKGDHLNFSAFTNEAGYLDISCDQTLIKSLSIIALSRLTIDRDFKASNELTVIVMAPTWNIFNLRQITLDGKEHPKPVYNKKTPNTGQDGSVGWTGLPGLPGGNFVGIGEEFINGKSLTISVVGGNGQNGGDGGNGGNGEVGLSPVGGVSINCNPAECERGGTPIKAKTDKDTIHTFTCFLKKRSDILELTSFISMGYKCTFLLKGALGRPSGNGGNSGSGGLPGNPGNILLIEIGDKSEIVRRINMGKAGKDGAVGLAGLPGKNGQDFKFERWSYLKEFITTDDVTENIDGDPLMNGVNGIVDRSKRIQAKPSNKDYLKEVSNVVSEYKGYLIEHLNLSDTNDFRVQFYFKIDKNEALNSMYDTLSLVNEMKILEKRFHTAFYKSSFLLLYQSLLNRTDNYAKHPESKSKSSAEDKKVLTYLYTTILGREYNLKDSFESNLIVDIHEYLTDVSGSILKYKQSNKVHVIEKYRESYEVNINQKTEEANTFINNVLIPELGNVLEENKNNIDSVIQEIIELQREAEINQQKIDQSLIEFKEKMLISMCCDVLSLVGEAVKFIPKIGAITSVIIGAGVSVVESHFNLNEKVDIPPVKEAPPEADIAKLDLKLMRVKAINDLNELIEFSTQKLNENSDDFKDLLERIDSIKNRLEKVTDLKGVSQLREELYQVIKQEQDASLNENYMQTLGLSSSSHVWDLHSVDTALQIKGKNKKKDKGNDDKGKGNESSIIDYLSMAVGTTSTVFGMFKKWKKNQETLNKLVEAGKQQQKVLNQLREYENSVRNDMGPALDMMTTDVVNAASSLGGKSQVSLEISKWQIQTKLQNMMSAIKSMVQGLKSSQLFTKTFTKIKDTINTLINIFNYIQRFQEQTKWANYIADINSAGSQSIKVTDRRLQQHIDYLDLILNCNIVVEQYQIAINAFKQYVFPLAHFYLKELVLPSYLNYSEDLEGLVSKAETQINHMQKKLKEYRNTATRLDSFIGEGQFNSKYRSTSPFFVWNHKTDGSMIEKLLSGEKVIIFADVKESFPSEDAIKFTEIEFNFKASNKKMQSVINDALKRFQIVAVHMGNSYFRTNGQYFLLTTKQTEFWYTLEKNRQGKPMKKSQSITKIKQGNSMLSPYATWSLQLNHISENNPRVFEVLKKYKHDVEIELIGRGHYINKDTLDVDIKVDLYYTSLD